MINFRTDLKIYSSYYSKSETIILLKFKIIKVLHDCVKYSMILL